MRKLILRNSLIFGALAGVSCFLFFLAMYFSFDNPLSLRRPDLGINVIFIFFAIWYYKKQMGGFLHFYEGFSIGFLTNIIGAFISGILIYLFIEFIDLKPFTTWILEGKLLLIKQKDTFGKILNDESFRRQLLSFDNAKPYQLFLDELMFKQLAIIFISLMSMVMRKQGDAIS